MAQTMPKTTTTQRGATPKSVVDVRRAPGRHWVGDGFPVHGMFGYNDEGADVRSPFLLMDYAAPYEFRPSPNHRRGVGQHPHRGFETVTIVYAGEVEHRDTTGGGGVIGPGDVQWMTAGGGIQHDEFHSPAYSEKGGPFEMVQLWVNLPAKDKMTPAHYQGITNAQIPVVELPNGKVRVIAGEYEGVKGPATTYSPMNVLDMRLGAGEVVTFTQPEGWSTLVVMLDGTVLLNDDQVLRAAEMATLSTDGQSVTIESNNDAKFLVLAGEPLDEPVVGYGPFVMNSNEEIAQAINDFNSGKFGQIRAR
ncbi:MAG: pirin family protein [Polyangiales bacterium]